MGKLTKMAERLSEEKVESAGAGPRAEEAYKMQVTWFLEDLLAAMDNFIQAFRNLRGIKVEIIKRKKAEELEMIRG